MSIREVGILAPFGDVFQVTIRANRAAVAAQIPSYLIDMPDPAKTASMQMLSFYRFFDTPKSTREELEVGYRCSWTPSLVIFNLIICLGSSNSPVAFVPYGSHLVL